MPDLREFGERYALRTFPEGGIVVDLKTGSYSRTNRSATVICAALLSSGPVAPLEIASTLGIDTATADDLIRQVIDGLAAHAPRRVRPDPFIYAMAGDAGGYVLSANDLPKLLVSGAGDTVKVATPSVLDERHLYDYLRALAPRLAFLRGRAVIHGAACTVGATTFAICGDSGAGKTTTARAFAAAGAELIAEDMLVIDHPSPLRIKTDGEKAIHAWASETAARLRREGRADASTLEAAWEGPSTGVQQLWFIAAEGRLRDQEQIVRNELDSIDATLTSMASLFLGGTSADDWRRFLDLSAQIAESVSVFHARAPSGLEALARAAEAYTRSSAS